MYTERALLSWHTRNRFMLTNLACPSSRLRGEWDYTTVQGLHQRLTRSHGTEGWKDASENNEWIIVQCATFSRSLNPRNIDKSVSDIRILIQFPFESSFWISVPGCKLTILPDIQPANRIVILFCTPLAVRVRSPAKNLRFTFGNTALQPARPADPQFDVIPPGIPLVGNLSLDCEFQQRLGNWDIYSRDFLGKLHFVG